jgi:hypothetical protein
MVTASRASGPAGSVTGRRSVCRKAMAWYRRIAVPVTACRPPITSRARCSGWLGSGYRMTPVSKPSAASATRAWCRAAPQLTVSIRPSGSVAASFRSGAAHSSREVARTFQCHGCVLWMDGAYPPASAASRSTSVSDSVRIPATVRPRRPGRTGPKVPGPWCLGPCAAADLGGTKVT